MKIVKWTGVLLTLVLIGIQFIPTQHNQSDIVPDSDITKIYRIPDQVATILRNSCYDCHSNNTRYPWYSKVQPIGMWMADHINHAKEELNFNEFGDYSVKRKKKKLKEITEEIEEDEMPLPSYTWIHRDAQLSKDDKKALISWATDLNINN